MITLLICIVVSFTLSAFVGYCVGRFIMVGKGPWEDDDGEAG